MATERSSKDDLKDQLSKLDSFKFRNFVMEKITKDKMSTSLFLTLFSEDEKLRTIFFDEIGGFELEDFYYECSDEERIKLIEIMNVDHDLLWKIARRNIYTLVQILEQDQLDKILYKLNATTQKTIKIEIGSDTYGRLIARNQNEFMLAFKNRIFDISKAIDSIKDLKKFLEVFPSLQSDLADYLIENPDFLRKVCFNYADFEILLRLLPENKYLDIASKIFTINSPKGQAYSLNWKYDEMQKFSSLFPTCNAELSFNYKNILKPPLIFQTLPEDIKGIRIGLISMDLLYEDLINNKELLLTFVGNNYDRLQQLIKLHPHDRELLLEPFFNINTLTEGVSPISFGYQSSRSRTCPTHTFLAEVWGSEENKNKKDILLKAFMKEPNKFLKLIDLNEPRPYDHAKFLMDFFTSIPRKEWLALLEAKGEYWMKNLLKDFSDMQDFFLRFPEVKEKYLNQLFFADIYQINSLPYFVKTPDQFFELLQLTNEDMKLQSTIFEKLGKDSAWFFRIIKTPYLFIELINQYPQYKNDLIKAASQQPRFIQAIGVFWLSKDAKEIEEMTKVEWPKNMGQTEKLISEFVAKTELETLPLNAASEQKNSLTDNWAKTNDQAFWILLRDKTLLLAKEYAKKNPNMTFEDLYTFFCEKRNQIAYILNQYQDTPGLGNQFGIKRGEKDFARTPIFKVEDKKNRYASFFDYLYKKISDCSSQNANVNIEKYQERCSFEIKDDETNARLSTIMIDDVDRMMISHTSPENLAKIMNKCNEIFKELKSPHCKEPEKKLGELCWYACQAMFCIRGNASVMEMICTFILSEQGINDLNWKHPAPMDLEAIFEVDKQRFSDNFIHFFEPAVSSKKIATS